MRLAWHTDTQGLLSAEVGRYRVTVERLLPAVDARFIVWTLVEPPAALASRILSSTEAAMASAEEAVNRLLGPAASRDHLNPGLTTK